MLDILPVEILITIFGLLSPSDRRACRLTCKQANYASWANSFTRNESIKVDKRMLKPHGKSIIKTLINTDRSIFHVFVADINNYDYVWVFKKFGDTLQTVILKNCSIDYYIFSYIVSNLKAAHTLRIINCDNFLLEGNIFLSTAVEQNKFLKRLEISNTVYLTDKTLSGFLALFPNINHLSLENTTMNCHQGVFRYNYTNCSNILELPSANVLTINYVSAVINSKRRTITSLNISKTVVNNMALSEILRIEELNLYYLNINFCRELRPSNNMVIGYWQPALTELHMADCDLLTSDLLEHICKNMRNLKILNISQNNNVNDAVLPCIDKLVHLNELDISDCKNLSGTVIACVICSRNLLKSLRKVRLNKTKISNDNLVYIASMLTLFELDISNCTRLTTASLSLVFENQKRLKKLEMADIYITDSGITGLSELSHLPLDDLKEFEYEFICQPSVQEDILKESERYYNNVVSFHNRSSPCIQDLKILEILNLSKCKILTDYIFATPLQLTNLRELNLAGLPLITLKTVIYLVHNCPAIEILNLSGSSVNDVGICVLAQKMTRLKHLVLKDCLYITNKTLIFITEHCKTLQTLNIQGCSNLKEELLNRVKKMPNIVEVIGRPNEIFGMDCSVPLAPPSPFF